MTRKLNSTDQAPGAVGPYSQGVLVDGWLWTCGQIGLDPATGEMVGEDAATQAEQVLRNLQAVLAAGGCAMDQVVRTTVYLTSMDDFAAVNEVYAGFFSSGPPARSCVEVRGLPKGALIEIDAVARAGN